MFRALELVLPGIIFTSVIFIFFSNIPWAFTYLEVGRIIGPVQFIDSIFLALFVVTVPLISFGVSLKSKKNQAVWLFALSVMLSFLVISSFSIFFMSQVSQAGKRIDTFVAENVELSFQDYALSASLFLNSNVRSAWDKPEAVFRIDNWVSNTPLDPCIMKVWGVTRADLIVYQGWGACGQAAILLEELFLRAGYETRDAHFKGIDHQWAEVKHNGTWWMIDPWYIGNLTQPFAQPQNLKNLKPAFQKASGVEVQYPDGTIADASIEHGY
jgi:hypothetical protein